MAYISGYSRVYVRRRAVRRSSNNGTSVIKILEAALKKAKAKQVYFTNPYRSSKKAYVSNPRRTSRFRRKW